MVSLEEVARIFEACFTVLFMKSLGRTENNQKTSIGIDGLGFSLNRILSGTHHVSCTNYKNEHVPCAKHSNSHLDITIATVEIHPGGETTGA
jgi:hypothetical protein